VLQRSCVFIGVAAACIHVGCDPAPVDSAGDRANDEAITRDEPLDVVDSRDEAQEVDAPRAPLTYDDLLAQVAEEAPDFAGMYYAEEGVLVLVLLEPDAQAAVEQALDRTFGEALLRGANTIRVEPAQFSFSELKLWHDRLSFPILALPGAVSTDIDERSNIIRVGMANEDAERRARVELRGLGVPEDIVTVEHAEPVPPSAVLQDFVRPLVGGLQIATLNSYCSLGFPAIHGVTPGFVTNSHCTDIRGVVESTQVYSPTWAPGNWVGTEALDPASWANGCVPGRVCRYSDAAFIASNAGSQGLLAASGGLYDFNIYGTSRVVEIDLWPLLGQAVAKTGRTTSTTAGNVNNTCMNTIPSLPAGSPPFTLVCDYSALGPEPMALGGDSGSPVYTNLPYNRRLVGVTWGRLPNLFYFSPLGGIFNDMGPMKVCVPNKPC
jgi:hypothetical protein